jgi:hypothetical protein
MLPQLGWQKVSTTEGKVVVQPTPTDEQKPTLSEKRIETKFQSPRRIGGHGSIPDVSRKSTNQKSDGNYGDGEQ